MQKCNQLVLCINTSTNPRRCSQADYREATKLHYKSRKLSTAITKLDKLHIILFKVQLLFNKRLLFL